MGKPDINNKLDLSLAKQTTCPQMADLEGFMSFRHTPFFCCEQQQVFIVLLNCRYALFIFNLTSNFDFCNDCCSSVGPLWFLFLITIIFFTRLIQLFYFLLECSPIGYRYCTALSSSDFPHLILAARTVQSFSRKSSIAPSNLYKFLFCSSNLMMKTASIAKAGRFFFLHLILFHSSNDFKYSLFYLFHALSLLFLACFALFCRSHYIMLMSSSMLNASSHQPFIHSFAFGVLCSFSNHGSVWQKELFIKWFII